MMVLLALTPFGLKEALQFAGECTPVWCGADAISEEEFHQHEHKNLTRFSYTLADASQEELENAISTITEHHPNQRVWVEAIARP